MGPVTASAGTHLFVTSGLLLFLELVCIRWFPAQVLYLSFFTNTVLLASFLGMSIGCLLAGSRRNFAPLLPFALAVAMIAARAFEMAPDEVKERLLHVGSHDSSQMVHFGTEEGKDGSGGIRIPIEAVGSFFFVLVALIMIGPAQEMGRSLARVGDRVVAYSINIAGNLAGILLFTTFSWFEQPPSTWFAVVALGTAYLLAPHVDLRRILGLVALPGIVLLGYLVYGVQAPPERVRPKTYWSPYYRIDYQPLSRSIFVNLMSHQEMADSEDVYPPYALPHLLNRDAQREAGIATPRPFEQVTIIGAGSGNDVSRALQWGARHVDAVEIDPVIQRLGALHHPAQPYQDPRVSVHLNDGRNHLRESPDARDDLIIYALVDSLILHSGFSDIRLESYLFTDEAFADVRRCLKPGGLFVMYNFFRQGWIVSRLHRGLQKAFGSEPIVLTCPYLSQVDPDGKAEGFTIFIAGGNEAMAALRAAFQTHGKYWISTALGPGLHSPNGFRTEKNGYDFGPAKVLQPREGLETATDDWPFLYLRRRMIPDLSVRGMAIMGFLAYLLIALVLRGSPGSGERRALDPRMFFLGAGFMLVETKAVVHMALLFGSTWIVNSVVFFAILLMILGANLFVMKVKPQRTAPFYAALFLSLGVCWAVPVSVFLGAPVLLQVVGSCLVAFAPIVFAAIIFAVSFGRSAAPDWSLGLNIAGAILGGLVENVSMLLGFRHLVLVAVLFYFLSLFERGRAEPG